MGYPANTTPELNDDQRLTLKKILLALTGGGSGGPIGLTDTQLRATPVPVSLDGSEKTPVPVAVGASANSTIPATATSWAFVLLTGTGTIGGVAAPLGVPLSGGPLAAALAYTTAGSSSAFILYEIPA